MCVSVNITPKMKQWQIAFPLWAQLFPFVLGAGFPFHPPIPVPLWLLTHYAWHVERDRSSHWYFDTKLIEFYSAQVWLRVLLIEMSDCFWGFWFMSLWFAWALSLIKEVKYSKVNTARGSKRIILNMFLIIHTLQQKNLFRAENIFFTLDA